MVSGTCSAMSRTCSSLPSGSAATHSVGYHSASGRSARSGAHASRYARAAGAPLRRMSWLWAWMMVAPVSRQRAASARISSGVIGTFGLRSLVVPPLMAASISTGTSPMRSTFGESGEELRRDGARHLLDLVVAPHREWDVRIGHGHEAVPAHAADLGHGRGA